MKNYSLERQEVELMGEDGVRDLLDDIKRKNGATVVLDKVKRYDLVAQEQLD